jgi:hypothetical protein
LSEGGYTQKPHHQRVAGSDEGQAILQPKLQIAPEKPKEISDQEELAKYIKYTLSKAYQGRIVVLDVSILFGHGGDLSVTVCARNRKAIQDFVTKGLRGLGGILSTSTSEEVWTCPPMPELEAAADQVEV